VFRVSRENVFADLIAPGRVHSHPAHVERPTSDAVVRRKGYFVTELL